MNRTQSIKIESFCDAMLEHANLGGRIETEIKDKVIVDHGGSVELRIRVGQKDDAGTLAEIYCREFRQVVFGPRGRVTCRTVGKNGETKSVKINGFNRAVRG